MKVSIVGAGYVGLVCGAGLAELGARVVCIDVDYARIASLRAGVAPIREPGLDALIARNLSARRLAFAHTNDSVRDSDAVVLAVGTPSSHDGEADMRFVFSAVDAIAPFLSDGAVVVTKSTVPVGAARDIAQRIARARPQLRFSVASNPEFLREGSAVADFFAPDRIVIGARDERTARVVETMYMPLARSGVSVIHVSPEDAELIKYASNAFLAMKVAFINEVADLCEKVGGDVERVACGVGRDSRIGERFLKAGPGFGGSCFPKDTRAFARTGRSAGAPLGLVEATIAANERRRLAMVSRVLDALDHTADAATICMLGLAFKGGCDDLRDSPAIGVAQELQRCGAKVRAFDPAVGGALGVRTFRDAYAAARGAHAVVIMTDWPQFAQLDLARLRACMHGNAIIDARNMLDAKAAHAAGFVYVPVGRPAADARAVPIARERRRSNRSTLPQTAPAAG